MMQTNSRTRAAPARKEPRCIYCGGEKDGIEVREDAVVAAMRWFNRRVLKKYRNYKLVVCKECYLDYKKARKRFMRKQVSYLAIGFLFAALLIAVSPDNAFTYVYGIVVITFMYLLSLVSYVPALKTEAPSQQAAPPGPSNRAKNVRKANRTGLDGR